MKRIGMWILLILSAYFAGYNLNELLGEFRESYIFFPRFLLVALISAVAACYLARDLGLFAEKKVGLVPKKADDGRELTELDLFAIYNRDLLDNYFSGGRGERIELKNGVDFYACGYWLVCKPADDGSHYDLRLFRAGGKTEVQFDSEITDHLDLLDHLWWLLRNYGTSPYVSTRRRASRNVFPLRRSL